MAGDHETERMQFLLGGQALEIAPELKANLPRYVL